MNAYQNFSMLSSKAQDWGHACNCMGPRPGDPVCPCMMPAHREREAGKKALEIVRTLGKPRFRVKAGRSIAP